MIIYIFFFFSSRRRHTRFLPVSWARRKGGQWWQVQPWWSSYNSVFRRLSKSACTLALTSRRRICSAPLTANAATCSRKASRALMLCCSASTLAAATILLPSSVAFDLASSTMAWPRRSASARRAVVSVRDFASSASTRLLARESSDLALSAAARPSAILLARSSSAAAINGHTNFIVNSTSKAKTMACASRVPLMLTVNLLQLRCCRQHLLDQTCDLSQERIGSGKPQRNTGADNESRVNQTGQHEHLGLEFAHELGLTRRRFKVFAAHDADANTSTQSAQTDDQASSQRGKTNNFHDSLLNELKKRKQNQCASCACPI